MSHDANAIHQLDHAFNLSVLQILHILDEVFLLALLLFIFLHLGLCYSLKTAFNLVSNPTLDMRSQVLR